MSSLTFCISEIGWEWRCCYLQTLWRCKVLYIYINHHFHMSLDVLKIQYISFVIKCHDQWAVWILNLEESILFLQCPCICSIKKEKICYIHVVFQGLFASPNVCCQTLLPSLRTKKWDIFLFGGTCLPVIILSYQWLKKSFKLKYWLRIVS